MKEFGRLVEAEIPRLRRYARALYRGHIHDADDLVQETLARAVVTALNGNRGRTCALGYLP